MLQRLSRLSLILLALSLPFELEQPWLQLGPLALTNVELLLVGTLTLSALSWYRLDRQVALVPRAWRGLGFAFVVAIVLSALLAPDYQLNAFKAAMRTVSGLALALAVIVVLRRRRDLLLLAAALVTGGLIAALIGLAEIGRGADFAWLAAWRQIPSVAGPFLRLSGPFDYANQAAMYIEATLPLLVSFIVLAWGRGRKRLLLLIVLIAGLALYVQAAIFTFSRASFFALVIVNLGLAVFVFLTGHRHERRRLAFPFAALAVLVLLLFAVDFVVNPIFRLRLASEADNDWYLAQIQAPDALVIGAGDEQEVSITVANEGVFTWRSEGTTPINIAARWVQPDSGRELSQRPRWPLDTAVPPGETITQEVILRAPQEGGEYHLMWDMVQEQVIWFAAKTGRERSSLVTVSGDAIERNTTTSESLEETFEEAWEFQAPIPGRFLLWETAGQLWRERPWTGIGLDNFRLLYGPALGYQSWNDSIHTNNMFIEMVVSLGLVGSTIFLAWLALFVWEISRVIRSKPVSLWTIAMASGILVFVVHGFLDYFLLFNATGLLFWMLVGMWRASRQPGQDHA